MKTLNEIKDEVAKSRSEHIKDFEHFARVYGMSATVSVCDEAAELYAAQFKCDTTDKKEIKDLLREVVIRANLLFPTTEEEVKWFDERFDEQYVLMNKLINIFDDLEPFDQKPQAYNSGLKIVDDTEMMSVLDHQKTEQKYSDTTDIEKLFDENAAIGPFGGDYYMKKKDFISVVSKYNKAMLIRFYEKLQAYTHESHTILGHDEREPEEVVNIFLSEFKP